MCIIVCQKREQKGDYLMYGHVYQANFRGTGLFTEFHGILWNSTAFHGIPRHSMEFHGVLWNSTAFYGIPRHFMEFHGILWNSTAFYGIPRHSMEFHGILWNATALYGMPRNSMEFHGILWNSIPYQVPLLFFFHFSIDCMESDGKRFTPILGVKRLGRKRLGRKRLGGETSATPLSCWNQILKAFANSLDPDETPQNVASHQDPNCDDDVVDLVLGPAVW
ncbi:hypothetical protein DPMN_063324 [Dreissena polymorpha]|uniref:Uncharacterized protein n=1 Tax=Dreissena polymorpha TaxID=45954 RepID=A0A9D4HIH9_DREPO|nr:hypothetical protein DPMN_063324 [Dreissena polymorpha]